MRTPLRRVDDVLITRSRGLYLSIPGSIPGSPADEVVNTDLPPLVPVRRGRPRVGTDPETP